MPGNLFSVGGNCGPVARWMKRRGGVWGKQAGRQCTCKSFSWIGAAHFRNVSLGLASVCRPTRVIPLCMASSLVISGAEEFSCSIDQSPIPTGKLLVKMFRGGMN